MSRFDWACLATFILGFILFIIGANIYNSVVGGIGIVLFIGSIVFYISLYVFKELTKPTSPSTPTPAPAQTP
jgi:membrane-bound ClpP family serine protease